MVAGYHLIWTAYGWWLPNDPRGSSSHEIRVAAIEPLGELHHGRKIIQPSRRKHREKAEEMIHHLQEESRQAMVDAGRRRVEHPVWGGPGWKVFLETRQDFERTIKYIQDNPLKTRMPARHWGFVQPYDGWMPYVPHWLKQG